jgi:hypothetical protein
MSAAYEGYLRVLLAAAAVGGYVVRSVDRARRSAYLKLQRAKDGYKIAVRISDHGSGTFKAGKGAKKQAYSVRVCRPGGLGYVVGVLTKGAVRLASCAGSLGLLVGCWVWRV